MEHVWPVRVWIFGSRAVWTITHIGLPLGSSWWSRNAPACFGSQRFRCQKCHGERRYRVRYHWLGSMSNLSLSPNYLTGLDRWPWKVPYCPASLPGRWVSPVYAFRWYFWSKVWHSKTYHADQRIMGNRKWSWTFEVCFPRGIYNIFLKCDLYTQLSAGGRKNIDGLCACLGSWRGPS